MAKVIAPSDGAREIQIGGSVIHRRKGGFEVPDWAAKHVAEAVGGHVAGIAVGAAGRRESAPTGPWCEHGRRPFYCEECTD